MNQSTQSTTTISAGTGTLAGTPAGTGTPLPTFDEKLESLTLDMRESYEIDENGQPITLDENQKEDISQIIDTVKRSATNAFKPLYDKLKADIAAQNAQIAMLRQKISEEPGKSAVVPVSRTKKQVSNDDDDEVAEVVDLEEGKEAEVASPDEIPSPAWIIKNRKSKKEAKLTGYNCYTMHHMAMNKSGFPIKGSWEKQDQAAWKALAAKVNEIVVGPAAAASSSKKAPSAAAAATAAAAASFSVDAEGDDDDSVPEVLETKGKGKAVTAYNLWTRDYTKQHPGAGLPPKGTWGQVPKDIVEQYKVKAKKLQAMRA